MSTILSPGTEITDEKIVIPCAFIRPPLTSNDRKVWQQTHREKQVVREDGRIKALSIRTVVARNGWTVPIAEPIEVLFVWSVVGENRWGADAAQPTLKAFQDGLIRGGLIRDDPHRIVVDSHCRIHVLAPEPGVKPSCRVEITRAEP